jgi:hypothetical protein
MKSGYKDYLDQYTNLVNQPTWADNLGDAYSKAGSQPAHGASQRSTNALLAGVGAGFKGGAAQDRQEQLSPLLQQVGQITAKAAEIEAQTQKAQQYQFAVQEFGQKYTPLVATFAELVNSNDPRATIVFKDLVNKAGSIPGYENLEAESWDSSKGYGLALNTQTGEYRKITADEMISAIAPSAQAIYGDKWFEKFLPLNAGVAKDAEYAFNTNRQNTELGMSEKRADIANKYSQAELHNTQADKTKHEMNNPPMSPAQIKTKEINEGRFATRHDNTEEKRILNNAYSQYQDNILDAQKKGLTGKSKPAEWKRYWAEVTGQSENMDIEEMLRITHANRVKELGGSNANMKQFEVAMDSAPSIKKDPDATIKFLDDIIAKNNEFIEETDHLGQIWEQNQYQGQERAILNDFRSQKKPTQSNSGRAGLSNNNGMVNMTNSFGQIFQIPADQVEAALHDEEEPLTLVK